MLYDEPVGLAECPELHVKNLTTGVVSVAPVACVGQACAYYYGLTVPSSMAVPNCASNVVSPALRRDECLAFYYSEGYDMCIATYNCAVENAAISVTSEALETMVKEGSFVPQARTTIQPSSLSFYSRVGSDSAATYALLHSEGLRIKNESKSPSSASLAPGPTTTTTTTVNEKEAGESFKISQPRNPKKSADDVMGTVKAAELILDYHESVPKKKEGDNESAPPSHADEPNEFSVGVEDIMERIRERKKSQVA
jgi:hypothetical protein